MDHFILANFFFDLCIFEEEICLLNFYLHQLMFNLEIFYPYELY